MQHHSRWDSENNTLPSFVSTCALSRLLQCVVCAPTQRSTFRLCALPSLAVRQGCKASFTQHKPSPYQLLAGSRDLTFRHYLFSLCFPSKRGRRLEGVDKDWLHGDTNLPWRPSLASCGRLSCAAGRFTAAREWGTGASSQWCVQKMEQMELTGETSN